MKAEDYLRLEVGLKTLAETCSQVERIINESLSRWLRV
jgi:hypothetical protein